MAAAAPAHEALMFADASDPVTSLALSPINGAVAVGTASGSLRLIVDNISVLLVRRSEEAIGQILISQNEVVATVGDISLKRWALGALRYDSPPVAGAVHSTHAFPFAHSYGQCSTATCLASGSKLLISRGGVDRDCFVAAVEDHAAEVRFDLQVMGPNEKECWPLAYDGERVMFLANRWWLSVWQQSKLLCELRLERGEKVGAMQLLKDRAVGLVNGRLCVWALDRPSERPARAPHFHGWRREVLHFCLDGSEPSHVTLATLGTDRSVCFFEGALDGLVFKRRVSLPFARFHLGLPYFLRVLPDSLCFNDDCGVYRVNLA